MISVPQEYWFDQQAADDAVAFFADCLVHIEGERAGQPFILEPWQAKIVRDIFGSKRADGTRRYRTVYVEIPRKNGKSTWAAGIAIYLLICDGLQRAQIVSAASTREQAGLVFGMARDMIKHSPELLEQADIRQYSIVCPRLGDASYKCVSSEAGGEHGKNLYGILFDELHVQPNRELWDVLVSSRGTQRQPLIVAMTTAGYDRSSICWELHERAARWLENPDDDPSFYAALYAAAQDDDWSDREVWKKANPNLGVSVRWEFLEEEFAIARANPSYENTFRRLYLNQWTEQEVRWLPMHQWDLCSGAVDPESLRGQPCYAGLDLASTRDVNSFCLVFPRGDSYLVLPYFWCPREAMDDRTRQDRRQVNNWAANGLITAVNGPTVEREHITSCLVPILRQFDVQAIAYDPWGGAQKLCDELVKRHGLAANKAVLFPQTITNFSSPCKELERIVATGKLSHGGNPVLRWMASNTVIWRDGNDNLRPMKNKSSDKIDGIVALLMGLAGAMQGKTTTSVYEARGMHFL